MKSTHKVVVGKVDRYSSEYHSASVSVDGVPVAELLKDPTAEMAEWYTHDSTIRLNDGTPVDIPDQDWGSTIREARMYITAYIRGYLSVA